MIKTTGIILSMFFRQIKDPGLAQYAYLIGCQDTGQAILFEPERDIERYLKAAEKAGLKIVAAAETHIHADYLSGLRQFAETGVKVFASDEGTVDWKYEWLIDSNYNYQLLHNGDSFAVGGLKFEVIHTPGHTPEHISFMVMESKDSAAKPVGILTGDFVFVGDVGRSDLLETAAGQEGTMTAAAELLFESIQKFKVLPPDLMVWPSHGAGSACGKSLGAAPMSTVGQELAHNPSIIAADNKQKFVNYILTGQPEPPYYFGRMKRENKEGPAVLKQMPQPKLATPKNILERAENYNAEIVDTRDWADYRHGHLMDSLYVPLSDRFESVAGSYLEPDKQICLVVDERLVKQAVTALVRIGLDNITCYTTPEQLEEFVQQGSKLESVNELHFAQLKDIIGNNDTQVLDVRNSFELVETGLIEGAVNIAYTRLLSRKDELPSNHHLYIHCRSGNRSAFACGFLKKHGYKVTNVKGGIEDWLRAGGEVVAHSATHKRS